MNTRICPQCHAPIPFGAPGGLCPACVLRAAEEPLPAGRTAPSLAEISAAFPQLEVLRLIGQGGMGFVYQARQPSLDRMVALKILAPELGRDPAFAERFAREARVLGKLSHPNIVTVFEHGQSGGYFYLLMEYIEGVNLRQAMRAGRFTPPQALAVVPAICDALQAAHAQGVWHRDIKPENILLDARGGVKIADFGIARIVGDPARDFTLTATGGALGSAAYMAPEQHESPHDVDHRADIYSLGVVIYEMLTGELPLGRFPAPSKRAAVSARIDEIVFQTLEKERELRQQSAAEVKTDVTRAARPGEADDPPSAAPENFWRMIFKIVLASGPVLFVAAAIFTHGSTQSAMLALATTLFAVGAVGLLLGKGTSRRPAAVVSGAPAKITVRSVALFLGGIITCAVGAWIYNGGMIAAVVAGVQNMADDMGVPTANRNVALGVGTFVLAVGSVASGMGYFGMWYALWQMRHGFISHAWRRGLQTMVTVPLAVLTVCVALFAVRGRMISAQREGLRRAQEALALAEQAHRTAPEMMQEKDARKKSIAAAQPADRTPGATTISPIISSEPTIPAETVFREMNAFANTSNGDEFRKRVSLASFGKDLEGPIASLMYAFLGRVKMLKDITASENPPLPKAKAPTRRTLFIAIERSDGRTDYWQTDFVNEEGAWLWAKGISSPAYRAKCRVEFRPKTGDAFNILRTHLGENVAQPVAGAEGQFELSATDVFPDKALRSVELIVENLQRSLRGVGLDSALKIIAPPTLPTLPMHAEETSAEKPTP